MNGPTYNAYCNVYLPRYWLVICSKTLPSIFLSLIRKTKLKSQSFRVQWFTCKSYFPRELICLKLSEAKKSRSSYKHLYAYHGNFSKVFPTLFSSAICRHLAHSTYLLDVSEVLFARTSLRELTSSLNIANYNPENLNFSLAAPVVS